MKSQTHPRLQSTEGRRPRCQLAGKAGERQTQKGKRKHPPQSADSGGDRCQEGGIHTTDPHAVSGHRSATPPTPPPETCQRLQVAQHQELWPKVSLHTVGLTAAVSPGVPTRSSWLPRCPFANTLTSGNLQRENIPGEGEM